MFRLEYKWRAGIVVMLGLFLSLLDNTIVSVALPVMQRTFSTDLSTITWVGAGYFLAEAAAIPVAGYLSDLRGTRETYVGAMALFVIASALCMVAPSKEALIATRVLQGLGAGLMFPTGYAIAYRAFPPEERGRATAIIGGPVVLAPAFGPVVGGFLTTAISWRAIFAINIPIGLVSLVLGWMFLHRRAEEMAHAGVIGLSRERFDVVGFVLSSCSFALIVGGLTQAGTRGWSDGWVRGLLVVGVVSLAILVVVEWRVPHPVLDVRLLLDGTFARANVLLWVLVALYYAGLYLIPYYFEQVRDYDASTAGAILLPQGLAATFGVVIGGFLYNRMGARLLAIIGSAMLAVSFWKFTSLSLDTSGASLQPWLILRGFGLALATQPLQNLALGVIPRPAMARASSVLNVTQQVAGAAGLATLASFLSQQVAYFAPRVASSCSTGLTTSCIRQHAIVSGLNRTFTVMMVAYALCLVAALFVGRDPGLHSSEASVSDAPSAIETV